MNTNEQVTTFSLEEPDTGKQVPVSALIKAINTHCRPQLKGESFCDTTAWDSLRKDERVPAAYRSLIAFAMEGESEGWYVHVGAIVVFGQGPYPGIYVNFGHAKMWSAEDAYDLCRETQRFLTAMRWNSPDSTTKPGGQMNPIFHTGTTIRAYSDSGPSKTRVETTMNVAESGSGYPLANVLPQTRKRRRGLTALQRIAILLAALFLIYLSW